MMEAAWSEFPVSHAPQLPSTGYDIQSGAVRACRESWRGVPQSKYG
jgi:hypothetical protein